MHNRERGLHAANATPALGLGSAAACRQAGSRTCCTSSCKYILPVLYQHAVFRVAPITRALFVLCTMRSRHVGLQRRRSLFVVALHA